MVAPVSVRHKRFNFGRRPFGRFTRWENQIITAFFWRSGRSVTKTATDIRCYDANLYARGCPVQRHTSAGGSGGLWGVV